MIGFSRKLFKDRRGNVLAIAGAALPLILGAAGLSVDTIQWTLWKRQLQRAADSGAMAGVYTRLKNNTQDAVEAAVEHDKELNLHTWMELSEDPTIELLGNSGNMRSPVRVTYRIQQSLPFSSLFMSAAPVITAVSTAASVPNGGEYCVLAKDVGNVEGLTITGSTYLDLGTCSLMANSSHAKNAANNGNNGNGGSGSTLKAASLDAHGGVNYSKDWNVGEYNPYSEVIADPFSAKVSSIPTDSSGCTTGKSNISLGGNSDIDRSLTDTAGEIVCMDGAQTIKANVKLGPATYVINGGSGDILSMNNGSLTCDGCTIILTNFSDPKLTGSVKLTGGSLSLSPPRQTFDSDGEVTGSIGNQTWKGISIYQDPRANDGQSGSSPQNTIRGNSALSIQGAVYFGNQSLMFNGGGKDEAACLQIVAKRVTFSGNSWIKAASSCGAYGLSAIGGGRRVRLVG